MENEKPSQVQALRDEITRLRKELRDAHREEVELEDVRNFIFRLSEQTIKDAEWIAGENIADGYLDGIPTLFASDWHWGETVNPSEIQGVNSYNLQIAKDRCKNMFTRFIDIYTKQLPNTDYPGIVLVLGGDMLSGNIHDELKETNGDELLPCVISLVEELSYGIGLLLQNFKQVACFCVTGNHGRMTHKMRFKRRAYTNFDWLVYTMLERQFQDNRNVYFDIATGPDCLYEVANTKYLLTHGDSLGKGGDGMIGMLGPVTRGDVKRRNRQVLMHEPYDVMLCGHFHQLHMLRTRIVNGSLKGYDEFAHGLGFAPEPPLQASWITHPKHGITLQIPIPCEGLEEPDFTRDWVSWKDYD